MLRAVLGLALLWLLWRTIGVGYEQVVKNQDHYQLFDWLISYEAGFVRRGLTGEMVTWLSRASGVSRPALVFGLQTTCYAVLVGAVLWLLRRVALTPALGLLLVAPFVFPFPVLTRTAGFRKEVLAFAVLAIIAVGVARSRSDRSRFRLLLGGVLAFVLVVLSHEMLVVLLPGAAVLGTRVQWNRKRVLAMAAAMAMAGVVVLATVVASGGPEHVTAICADLRHTLADTPSLERCDSRSAVGWLQFDAVDGVARLQRDWSRLGPSFARTLPLVLLGLVPAVVETAGLLDRRTRRAWLGGTSAGVALTLPVFLFAIDWGRFVHMHAVALVLTVLVLRHGRQPPPRRWWSDTVLLLALPTYALGWHLQHTGNVFRDGWWARLLA